MLPLFAAMGDLAVLLLSLILGPVYFQDTPRVFTISGQVLQPDGRPAAGADVRISGQGGYAAQTSADDMGRFQFPNLTRGRYQLTATNPSSPGQLADRVEVEIGRFSPNSVSVTLFFRNSAQASARPQKPAMVSLGETAQNVPKTARKAFDEAVRLRVDKKYENALRSFTRAIELFSSFFQAMTERGHLLIAMGRAPEAAADFTHALELNPLYGPALRGSGICRFQEGKYSEAVQQLERAADAEPGNATNYLFMGTAQLALDRREQARASLRKALSLDPAGAARAHVYLANLAIKENKAPEALSELEAYFQAVPDPPDAEKLHSIAAQLRAQQK